MANKKAPQKMTIEQYNQIRRGYAESQNFDPDNLTEDQAHELDNLMEADRIFPPKPNALALPGAVNESDNPTAGNSGSLAPTEEVKPAPAVREATANRTVSVAARESDIDRVLANVAREGDRAGAFAGEVFAATYSNAFNDRLDTFVNNGLQATPGRNLDAFLSKHGF